MGKIKIKINLATLKYNALKLRANYQIPYKLAYYINQLDEDSEVNYVKMLMLETEHLMRVKGYYKKFKDVEQKANEELVKIVEKMGTHI